MVREQRLRKIDSPEPLSFHTLVSQLPLGQLRKLPALWHNATMPTWRSDHSQSIRGWLSPGPDSHIRLRLRLPIYLLVVLLILAFLTPDRVWTTLLIGLFGLLVIGYGWTRLLANGVGGSRRLKYGWVAVGDRLEEEFAIINRSAAPALWVEVVDESTVPGYNPAVVHSVAARESVRWRQSAVCMQRGHYHLGPWLLRTGDPFGLFEATRRYADAEEIIIHPPVVSHLPVPLPPGQSEGRAQRVSRSWHATINAAGVRDYQVQDPYNWIHWKTSARHDDLYVRQFERDAAGDIWLLIDCNAAVQLGTGPESTEETCVLLAASLAARAMIEARPVGLAVYGREPQLVPPGLGQANQWAILRALALMHADGDTSLIRAMRDLAEVARRGSAAIIITPSDSADWIPGLITLGQHGVESHVLLLDRAGFGVPKESSSTAGLQRAITESGFQCQVLDRDVIGQPLQQGERHGYWEFKVTPAGRAVAVRRPAD